jgi:hypothetical protein
MKLRKILAIVCLISLVSSCTKKQADKDTITGESKQEIEYQSVNIEKIKLDSINNSSSGSSSITKDGKIAFIDANYCVVSLFDTDGKLQSQHLGLGNGPGETAIGHIAAHTYLSDDKLVLFGFNLDFHTFKDYQLDNIFVLKCGLKGSTLSENSDSYTNQYNDMVCRSYKDKVYFNVFSDHPDFNYLNQTDDYMKNCYHIWEIDLNKQKDTRLLAKGYPEIYKKDPNKYLVFCGSNFDIDNDGNFYLSYEADSLIYVYNHQFEPIATYGFAGKDLDTDYVSIYSFEQSRKNYRNERNTKTYYYWTEYIDETGLLFRSYAKAGGEKSGLQIYRGSTLIGDVTAPKGFKVIGYIAPYYYSAVIPSLEENDTSLTIYRCKLND